MASILFSNQLNKEFAASGTGATSVAVAESDKWFVQERLLLEEDKQDMAAGPASTLAVLCSEQDLGGCYVVDSQAVTPGEHALVEADAEALWAYSLGLAQG